MWRPRAEDANAGGEFGRRSPRQRLPSRARTPRVAEHSGDRSRRFGVADLAILAAPGVTFWKRSARGTYPIYRRACPKHTDMKQLTLAASLVVASWCTCARAQQLPDLSDLTFRNVGPSRGGRVTAVCGDATTKGTFFMGATGGGVWKTTDFGNSWNNVSDGFFKTPSIGAIAVAHDDGDLVWVGTGSDGLRSNVIPGRGVYKSTDGGATWACAGLEDTGQIGAVLIHPTDRDVVFVAAIGDAFAPSEARGVYRTQNGGETWERVFRVSTTCGAVDLEFHPANPDVVYASMWEAERKPWTIKSGGAQGGVWRTTDGGRSWAQLGGGLPTGVVGKSDLAVSPAEPDRLWVLIEALEDAGLYRSDDAGKTFAFVSNQRGILDRPFYYCNIDCDPTDADHLFASATGYQESTDGGERWRRRFTPHGDNHEVWIHPADPKLMVQCNDGGANVTIDGGETWSRQNNQPTAELYQVAVDDRFPYWLYAGQQDNSTIRVPSRPPHSATGGVGSFWESVGGCETGPAMPKPGDADIVYANCKGRFGVYNHRTGQERHHYVGAQSLYGHNPKDLLYRFQRVAPISISPHDPDVVYHGSQYLHRTRDDGQTWETISPDLTAFEPDRQVVSGYPITRDITGEEYYSTLYEIAESPVQQGLIWTGANDGPIYLTRDDGESWTNVTPKMPRGGRVQTIEPSWADAGTAYACVLRYQLGDPSPHLYKTVDFGQSWTRLRAGLPENCPTRVVREDPQDPSVVYLGTEWGLFVSLDAGQSWRTFQQNLPVTPITDMLIHHDDLVLSTMGRSFWILDDVSAMRGLKDHDREAVTLFAPRQTWRTRLSGAGCHLHYALPANTDDLRLEIRALDPQRTLVRTVLAGSGRPARGRRDQGMRAPFTRGRGGRGLSNKQGFHRYTWNLRGEGRSMVLPGTYELRLVHADGSATQQVEVALDPRVAAEGVTREDLAAQAELVQQVAALGDRANTLAARVRERLREPRDDDTSAALQQLGKRLNNARQTYPQQMLLSQIRYLSSMIGRADGRPGNHAYQRYTQLVEEVDDLERTLAEVGGK